MLKVLKNALNRLFKFDIHYTRKENQLFPMLEAHHFTGPTQVMWSFHDDIRSCLKEVRQALEQNDPARVASTLEAGIQVMCDMIFKEEHIRYFALRDAEGCYRGTLEVSQDLTEIRLLKGEKRLLDWESP